AREDVRFCALVKGGRFIAHSDPALVGQAVPAIPWSASPAAFDASTPRPTHAAGSQSASRIHARASAEPFCRSGEDPESSGGTVLACPVDAEQSQTDSGRARAGRLEG